MTWKRFVCLAAALLLLQAAARTGAAVPAPEPEKSCRLIDRTGTAGAAAPSSELEEECPHVYRTEITDAAETEPGQIIYTCIRCGYTYTGEIPATGHCFIVTEVPADCVRPAYRTYQCERCGFTYREDRGPALGHDYYFLREVSDGTDGKGDRVLYQCRRCGALYSECLPAAAMKESYVPKAGAAGGSVEEKQGLWQGRLNMGDLIFILLELTAWNLMALILCSYITRRDWSRAQAREYRRHHIKWRE